MTARDQLTVTEQLQREIEKLGQQAFRNELRSAAGKALTGFPAEVELQAIYSTAERQILYRMRDLLERCQRVDDLKEPVALATLAVELGWATRVTDMYAAYLRRGPGGRTCAGRCQSEYGQCTNEYNCDDSGWICICCTPCSLQYMGCVARCASPV